MENQDTPAIVRGQFKNHVIPRERSDRGNLLVQYFDTEALSVVRSAGRRLSDAASILEGWYQEIATPLRARNDSGGR